MAIGEARRKFLQEKFEAMFPQMAEEVEKYGGWRNDNGTLCIYLKDGKGILAFNYATNRVWRLETYKCYVERNS